MAGAGLAFVRGCPKSAWTPGSPWQQEQEQEQEQENKLNDRHEARYGLS